MSSSVNSAKSSRICAWVWQAAVRGRDLKQQGHQDLVLIPAIDLERIALEPLGREAELFVERDRVSVVLPHRQLDPGKPKRARSLQRSFDQPPSQALSAKRRQKCHAEQAHMRIDRPSFR